MTLRLLVFGVLSLVTMIPLLLFWAWPHSRALQNEMDAVAHRNLQIAQTLGDAVSRYERDVRSAFSLVAINLIEGRNLSGGETTLASLGLRQVCVLDARTQRLLNQISTPRGDCPLQPAPERLAAVGALAISAEPRFSGVVSDRRGNPVLLLALRHRDRVAYGLLDTDDFVAFAEGIDFGEHGHAAIVDREGRLLAHPKPDWRQERRDISVLKPISSALDGRAGTAVFHSPATGAEMIAGFAPVPGPGWAVMVPQPLSELHAQAQTVQASALGVVAIGALAAGLLSWLLSGLLIRPLRAVADAARAMANGARAPEVGRIGQLAPRELKELRNSFNDMAEAVEASRKEQEEARSMAEEAYLTRSRFLAHMSHEIRTPLNAVIGFSEAMLRRTYGPLGAPKYEEYLRDIHESAHHLLSLINDLLDLSRVDVDDLPFEEADIRIDQVMSLSAALIKPRARDKAISIAVATEQPDLRLLGDPRLLRRVLLHLLSNAVTFTRDGGWVVMRANLLDSGELEIRVEDNGVGMSAKQREQALSARLTMDSGDPWSTNGTGRGLAIVARLLERHQGRLDLESEPELGTTAIITLPAARSILENRPSQDRSPGQPAEARRGPLRAAGH